MTGSLSRSVLTGTCGYLAVVAVLPTWCLPPPNVGCLYTWPQWPHRTTYLTTLPTSLSLVTTTLQAPPVQTQLGLIMKALVDLGKPTTTALNPQG